ncbi:hypothetical protein BLNAU_21684 [Blattamonas nauphoetae]|uniref:Uncharacterized protein n=1 Tax=Blattamonas nauphoetae TaxID=2049346 RepID=A0ABQ9WW74_9EUKA|nr:hypothetical protein BLNAU_21684 [Blattamonas nauphoetae]
MGNIINKMDISSSTTHSDLSSTRLPFSTDCSPFLRWEEDKQTSESKKAVVFRSLVATVQSQSALDVSLEAKAVEFLQSVNPQIQKTADAFLSSLASLSRDSSTNFIQCIVVLISSDSQSITTAAMEMLESLIEKCSSKGRLALVKAGLIPQLVKTLNPMSLSFDKAVDTHIYLLEIIAYSLSLATPDGLTYLGIEAHKEQQAVHETVLTQILAPSERYIWHLCANRYSIIDGDISGDFLELLTRILLICPYYRQTMDFVLNMPVFLTLVCYLAFFEEKDSIWNFLYLMDHARQKWNKTRREGRQKQKKMDRMLRMEGIEDVIEEKLQNDQNKTDRGWTADNSIRWSNQPGMNLPKEEQELW